MCVHGPSLLHSVKVLMAGVLPGNPSSAVSAHVEPSDVALLHVQVACDAEASPLEYIDRDGSESILVVAEQLGWICFKTYR